METARGFSSERALELIAQMRKATLDAIEARNRFKAAREARRAALIALRDARRRLNGFLEGRDRDAQIPLALNGRPAEPQAERAGESVSCV